jgi:hypothetical protein
MVIYDPVDDDRLEIEKPKRQIVGWSIRVEWDNGEEEDLIDVPDDVAGTIDMWLSEVEQEQKTLPYQHCGE